MVRNALRAEVPILGIVDVAPEGAEAIEVNIAGLLVERHEGSGPSRWWDARLRRFARRVARGRRAGRLIGRSGGLGLPADARSKDRGGDGEVQRRQPEFHGSLVSGLSARGSPFSFEEGG